MCLRWVFGSLALASLVLLLSFQAFASFFEPVRDRQIVCESSDIIHGQVTDVHSAWDDEGIAIWTTATVTVQDVRRGRLSRGGSIEIKEVGGTVNGYTIKAEGFPTFQEGDEVVLLLKPWEDEPNVYRVWGYGRGLFRVDRQNGRGPTAERSDVVEAGRPTMHVDQIPPAIVLDDLKQRLSALTRTCSGQGGPQ
jgi:hypothetical protein